MIDTTGPGVVGAVGDWGELARAVAAAALGVLAAIVGVRSWQGRVARNVPRESFRGGPGAAVLMGLGFVVFGTATAARLVLDRPADWWVLDVAVVVTVASLLAGAVYGFLFWVGWLPSFLVPPHHRTRRDSRS